MPANIFLKGGIMDIEREELENAFNYFSIKKQNLFDKRIKK